MNSGLIISPLKNCSNGLTVYPEGVTFTLPGMISRDQQLVLTRVTFALLGTISENQLLVLTGVTISPLRSNP